MEVANKYGEQIIDKQSDVCFDKDNNIKAKDYEEVNI